MSFSVLRRSAILAAIGIARAQRGELLWSEEFDGPGLDLETWNYDTGGGGWGNDEFQVYTDSTDNVDVADGALVITARKELLNGDRIRYTSGRVKTDGKFAFTYGEVEARIKLPDLSDGLWPALWMLGEAFYEGLGWPDCGELDIMEMGYVAWTSSEGSCINWPDWAACEPDCLGNGPRDPSCVCCDGNQGGDGTINRSINSAFHFENATEYDGYYCDPRTLAAVDFAGADTWVTVTLKWTPDLVQTFVKVDGTVVYGQQEAMMCEFDISNPDSAKDLEEFHRPFFFIANLAVGGKYTGLIYQADRITAPFPASYKIDYIRVYDNGHTVLKYNSATTTSSTTTAGGTTTTAPPSCGLKGAACTVQSSQSAECCSGICATRGPNLKCN